MRNKSTHAVVGAMVLLLSLAIGAAAQDEERDVGAASYSRGVAGEIPETVNPTQVQQPDGQLQLRGLQFIDIPVTFTDPRLTGRLTISSNGAGREFADGFARIEPRTYRIDAEDGSWTGSGKRVLAVTDKQPRPLINHESMVLFGDGAYEGLVAYVFIELANAAPELEAVVLDIEMAPLPEPIPEGEQADLEEPGQPASGPTAHAVGASD